MWRLLLPLAVVLIGLGVLLGVSNAPPRAGFLCVLLGTILAGVAVVLAL